MKVLLIYSWFYLYGGAERLIVKLANYLTEQGVSTTLLTRQMLPRIKERFNQTRIIVSPSMESLIPLAHSIFHKFDVINPHNDPAQLTLFPRKRPSVWMCNEPPIAILTGGPLTEHERDTVRRHIDIVVVADEYNRKRFKEIYDMDSRVNYYGVDFDFFKEQKNHRIKEKYGLSDTFTIMQVGMFTFTKNQMKTCSILKKLKKQIPEAHLVLVGWNDNPRLDTVQRSISNNNLTKTVTITGEIPQADLRDLYHAVDAVVAPIQPQGGWLSTFEAIATGRPMLVSPEMTASYLLKEHGIGIVTDEFVPKLVEIYEKPYSDLKGRQWVKENLKWDRFCGNMLSYFEEVMP